MTSGFNIIGGIGLNVIQSIQIELHSILYSAIREFTTKMQ